MNKSSFICNSVIIKKLEKYPPFMFNGKRIPMKVLDICQDQTDQIPITKSKSATKQHYRSKSTPSSFSELQISNNENQNNLPTKNSLLIPFRKAVQKISSQTKNANPRRKSCYGSLFGNIQQKQIDHLPTVIEMHRRINGKEFALSSFTQLLKKSQRNSPQCLTSKNKIIQEEFVVGINIIILKNMIQWKDLLLVRRFKIIKLQKLVKSYRFIVLLNVVLMSGNNKSFRASGMIRNPEKQNQAQFHLQILSKAENKLSNYNLV